MLDLELLLFQDMLSLRRRDAMEDGVAGSSGLDNGPGAGDFDVEALVAGAAWALGPDGFCGAESKGTSTGVVKSVPVLDLFAKAVSRPFLGTEDERKGETALWLGAGCDAVIDSEELFLLGARGLSMWVWVW